MNASMTSLSLFFEFEPGSNASRSGGAPRQGLFFARKRFLLWACILLSLMVHGLGVWLADFRPVHRVILDKLVILDLVAPSVKPAPVSAPDGTMARAAQAALANPPEPASSPPVAQTQAPKDALRNKKKPASVVQPKSVAKEAPVPQREVTPPAATPVGVIAQSRVGQIVPRQGVTVLANESGLDALKHGSEARFMHGVATEEFVEDNYIGEYAMGKLGRVWIEDDRARSGHLILHAEHMGFTRPLFRFNRFIYVYGESPDSPEPILGSVTFFSDGYHIHQFMWQHNATYAYYPRRD
jgi:hypothetical protein